MACKKFYIGLFFLFYLAFVYVHQDDLGSATPLSRLDLLHALFEQGTFQIDAYHDNTTDKALYDGHYYSDKPPGTFLLALPGFALAAGVLSLSNIPLDSDLGWLVSSWLAVAGSGALVGALGGIACYSWLKRWVSHPIALLTTLAVFLGAAPFPYATMLHSHAIEVGCIAIALWAITVAREKNDARWDYLAGLAAGLALTCQLTAGLIVAGLFVWLAVEIHKSAALRFSIGAFFPLLLIPIYSWICFDTPFTIGYEHQAVFGEMDRGLFGIQFPDPEIFLKLLFGPRRGLFFWSPFLLCAIFGYHRLLPRSPSWAILIYMLPLIQTLIFSGYRWDWPAGPVLGPRYLSPILPLLALPAALAVARWPLAGSFMALSSLVITGTATLTDASPPGAALNPLTKIHLPQILAGDFNPNLGQSLGLPEPISVLLWFAFVLTGAGLLLRATPQNT